MSTRLYMLGLSLLLLCPLLVITDCNGPSGSTASPSPEQPYRVTFPEKEGELVDLVLVTDKFVNEKQDRAAYLYEIRIVIRVHESDRSRLEGIIEGSTGRIRQDFVQFFREASPNELHHPERAAVKRAALEICNSRLGTPTQGGSFVEEVVIRDWSRVSLSDS